MSLEGAIRQRSSQQDPETCHSLPYEYEYDLRVEIPRTHHSIVPFRRRRDVFIAFPIRTTSSIPKLDLGVEIPRNWDSISLFIRRRRTSLRKNADPCFPRGRSKSVSHDLTVLRFVDERLPVQRSGDVGLGGERLLRLEVVEALLEEGAGGVRGWLVG